MVQSWGHPRQQYGHIIGVNNHCPYCLAFHYFPSVVGPNIQITVQVKITLRKIQIKLRIMESQHFQKLILGKSSNTVKNNKEIIVSEMTKLQFPIYSKSCKAK